MLWAQFSKGRKTMATLSLVQRTRQVFDRVGKMADGRSKICILSVILFNFVLSEGLPSNILQPPSSTDSCTTECLRRVSIDSNNVGGGESCARGCRFFTIAQLIGDKEVEGKSFKGEACKALCQESYGESGFDVTSCKTGCESFVVPNVQVPVVAEFSWSWFIDNGNSMQILQGDIPEPDDVLTDPSLRSQITRVETLRIPEIRLRTMPVLQEKGVTASGLCGGGTVRGIPYCLVWSLLLLLTLLGLWSCLSLEEPKEDAGRSKEEQAPPLPEKLPLV